MANAISGYWRKSRITMGGKTQAPRASDTQSIMSMNSVRTVDREKLRDKARQLQMKENLRLALCARIQQTLRKSPKVAEELAGDVLRMRVGVELSDEQLRTIVDDLCARRQEQKQLASSRTASEAPAPPQPESQPPTGRRSSSSGKTRGSGSRGKRSSKSTGKSRPPREEDLAPDDSVYVTQSQLQQLSTGFRLPPKVSPQKDKSNGIWEEIVKFGSVEEQQEAQRRRQEKERARVYMARTLEQQVHERHAQKQQDKQAASQFYAASVARLEQQEREEREKLARRLRDAQQLTQIQDEQRRAKAAQVARERAVKKAHEQHAAALLARQNDEERAREAAKKEAEKQRLLRVLAENEAELRRKQALKDQDRAHELALAAQYITMEEAKDAARRKQLEAMAENVKKRMKFFGDTAKADMDARALEEETRVRKYQEEYERQQLEAMQRKQAEAARRLAAQQEFLKQQMLEKKAREQQTQRELNKQAELWKQDRVEAEKRDKAAQQQRAWRAQSQQETLRQQMRDKEQRSLEADQTAREVQLNAKLLDKIRVVTETQHRSKELQQHEHNFLTTRL